MSYEEEDKCMSYEEEDTCMSYEEEDTYLVSRVADLPQRTLFHLYIYIHRHISVYIGIYRILSPSGHWFTSMTKEVEKETASLRSFPHSAGFGCDLYISAYIVIYLYISADIVIYLYISDIEKETASLRFIAVLCAMM